MKKVFALLLCLVLVFSVTGTFVAVEGGEEQYQQEAFSVVEKNLITGEETTKIFDDVDIEELVDEYKMMDQQPDYSREMITPYNIIGDNDLQLIEDTTDWPYSAVAFISIDWPGLKKSTRGTAFIISPNVAVTAAHNLYDADLNLWAKDVSAFPGMSDSSLIGDLFDSYKARVLGASTDWIERGDDNYDWGVIVLDEEINISDIGLYFFVEIFPSNPPANMPITVLGYPNTGSLLTNLSQHMSNGVITNVFPNKFLHNADTLHGSSGSPILNEDLEVIGINIANSSPEFGNIGVKIDTNAYIHIYNTVLNYQP